MEIKISEEFSETPGGRFIKEGPYSGELFRETILLPKYEKAIENSEILTIDFDGTYGYANGFLEEAFGGMIRNHSKLNLLNNLYLLSTENDSIIERINEYVNNAKAVYKR